MVFLNAFIIFFFNDTATTEIYTRPYTLSLHDALPISARRGRGQAQGHARRAQGRVGRLPARRQARPRSEEHTSELQSHGLISYAVFCLKKKKPKWQHCAIYLQHSDRSSTQ